MVIHLTLAQPPTKMGKVEATNIAATCRDAETSKELVMLAEDSIQYDDALYAEALTHLRAMLDDPRALFRDDQFEAIYELVENRARVLLVQRTGWGKSSVYFIATRMLRDRGYGPTLMISPLLALMRNQRAMGQALVDAETLNSSNISDWQPIETRVRRDEVDLLIVSPERLANERFVEQTLLGVLDRPGLIVIDEAHCISDWGHDFRPDYQRIAQLVFQWSTSASTTGNDAIPIAGTTATANQRVIDDITKQVGDDLVVMRGPLRRDTLQLQNIELPSQSARLAWLAHHLQQTAGSGIIYVLSVKDAERVAAWLRSQDMQVLAYHGRLRGAGEREFLERQLLNNEVKALVATPALSMGFDKPDLGFVIHFQRPQSVIHYYQQIGRAGRAIDSAFAILLSGTEDDDIANYFIDTAFVDPDDVRLVIDALRSSDRSLLAVELEQFVNLSDRQINQMLRQLAVQSPPPVERDGGRWRATVNPFSPRPQDSQRITDLRRTEQRVMREYVRTNSCLMEFLQRELDDPTAGPCGHCASCLGGAILSPHYAGDLEREAARFLLAQPELRRIVAIEPKVYVPGNLTTVERLTGHIPRNLQAEYGRVLTAWDETGLGALVQRGKLSGTFDDRLVKAAAREIVEVWQPSPYPMWVTAVPSR